MSPRYNMIDQPKFWKAFLFFLLPLIATNILQNLSGTINTIFVGQMMGVDAIAAISVKLFTDLDNPINLDFEKKHKLIIDRFGRYPHRNAILGRSSTEEEILFLQQPDSHF